MTWHQTSISRLLKIDYPIVQAPMAGGITVPKLVSSVSEAGALGSVGAGYLSHVQLDQHIKQIKTLTGKPFNVNLFVPEKDVSISKEAIREMTGILKKMNMPVQDVSFTNETSHSNYEKQLETVLLNDVPICSFTFGLPSLEAVRELKQAGRVVIGTATTVEEALLLEERGADAVVMQGSEAGGHRGTFNDSGDACIGTMALIPQAADALCVPVIAAGGIADARGIAAAIILGADGVQLGSVFIPCTESGAPAAYKTKILGSKDDETVLTRAFSGKYARGISNGFIEKMKPFENSILPYPLQNELTKRLRSQAAQELDAENMSLWAGQSLRLINESMSAKEVLDRLIAGVNGVTNSSWKDVNANGS